MLKKEIPDLTGKNAVIIGRSNIVGKPMASLLLSSNCTVTIAHSKTINLIETCKKADILIAAIGKPEMINEDYIKKNAIIIDIGINRIEQNDLSIKNNKSKLVGDVNYNKVFDIVDKITPVPGGVGPMTIACLMHNTLKAAFLNKNDPFINVLESM
jgi:methylenetetrahydrofolate dehydrogenase (NADP+)/methenyltetrahydrofolate cyclohydrolase